jgi:hypothetical protein
MAPPNLYSIWIEADTEGVCPQPLLAISTQVGEIPSLSGSRISGGNDRRGGTSQGKENP